jgi:mono/diheme cytochrome c family protein
MMRRHKLAIGLMAFALGASAAQAGETEKGHALAVKLCALCHVIDNKNPFGGIGSTPSFPLMAKYAEMFRPRIRTFPERRPHAQFQWDVIEADIAALETYIMSLAGKQ